MPMQADGLYLSSFEKKYGKSDPESIVRFFIGICLREINFMLGSAGLVWFGFDRNGLSWAWLRWAGLGWNRLGWVAPG